MNIHIIIENNQYKKMGVQGQRVHYWLLHDNILVDDLIEEFEGVEI